MTIDLDLNDNQNQGLEQEKISKQREERLKK